MTVRQYSQYEAKRDFRLLFRRFSFLPVRWFDKQIEAFTNDFNRVFSNDGQGELYRNIQKVIFQNKLIKLQALAEAIYVHLIQRAELDLIYQKYNLKREPDRHLAGYIEEVNKVTGIKIETLQDVSDFMQELERLNDKYGEMYAEKQTVIKSASILELFFIYCSLMEVNPDYTNMLLSEFADLKKQAEEKSKRMEASLKSQRNGRNI